MRKSTLKAIHSHLLEEYPKEACGLVTIVNSKEKYVPCRNIAEDPESHFVMAPEDYAAAEDQGEIVLLIHSHPDAHCRPSEADKIMCEATGLKWQIFSVYTDLITNKVVVGDSSTLEPSGYEPPLIGCTWAPPHSDCFSLVRRYYKQELGIEVPDFEVQKRAGLWWEEPGKSLYLTNYEEAGFVRVDDGPKKHDVIFMEISTKAGPNHAGIYLGDESSMMVHHLYGRLSERILYGGYWLEHTRMIVRHKDLCGKE